MQKWHRSSSAIQIGHRSLKSNYICSRCASRQLHSSSPLLDDQTDQVASPSNSRLPNPPRAGMRKMGSQAAGRMIMGLRGAAPGGFGSQTTSGTDAPGASRRPTQEFTQESTRRSTQQSSRGPTQKFTREPSQKQTRTFAHPQTRTQDSSRIISPSADEIGRSRKGQTRLVNFDVANAAASDDIDNEDSNGEDGEEEEEFDDEDFEEDEDDEGSEARDLEQSYKQAHAHLEWADQQVRGLPTAYKPSTHQSVDLVTNRTSTFIGKAGILAELETAMANLSRRNDRSWVHDEPVARRLIAGKIVRFKDDEERRRIVLLAEDLAARTANFAIWSKREENPTFVDKEDVGFVPLPREYRKLLGDRAMAGHYESVEGVQGTTEKAQVASRVKTALQLNNTYSPTQRKAFSDFVEKMWPEQRRPASKQ